MARKFSILLLFMLAIPYGGIQAEQAAYSDRYTPSDNDTLEFEWKRSLRILFLCRWISMGGGPSIGFVFDNDRRKQYETHLLRHDGRVARTD